VSAWFLLSSTVFNSLQLCFQCDLLGDHENGLFLDPFRGAGRIIKQRYLPVAPSLQDGIHDAPGFLRRRVEARTTHPGDRLITPDERGRRTVADQAVIFDKQITFSVTNWK
jgi:hypothetical protein